MHDMIMRWCGAFMVLSFCALGGLGLNAQEEQVTVPAEERAVPSQGQEGSLVSEAEGAVPSAVEAFVYLPRGRRDPFWDLLGNAKAGKDAKGREAIPGIAGLLIEEIELEGIIYIGGKYYASMRGPDSRPYLVTIGENVYDGEVVKIDSHSVVFKKILTIAIGGAKERLIAKRLNPEEEQEK
jgi:Tfp pilus assembly protein PilP